MVSRPRNPVLYAPRRGRGLPRSPTLSSALSSGLESTIPASAPSSARLVALTALGTAVWLGSIGAAAGAEPAPWRPGNDSGVPLRFRLRGGAAATEALDREPGRVRSAAERAAGGEPLEAPMSKPQEAVGLERRLPLLHLWQGATGRVSIEAGRHGEASLRFSTRRHRGSDAEQSLWGSLFGDPSRR